MKIIIAHTSHAGIKLFSRADSMLSKLVIIAGVCIFGGMSEEGEAPLIHLFSR